MLGPRAATKYVTNTAIATTHESGGRGRSEFGERGTACTLQHRSQSPSQPIQHDCNKPGRVVSVVTMGELKSGEQPWGPGKTASFRWFVIFSLAYIAPLEPLTDLVIPWIGHALLGIEHEIGLERTGSGDTTAAYIRLLLHVVAAGIGTLAWTLITNSRARYRKSLDWFTFAIRLTVAVSMLLYGFAKLGEGQFSSPSDTRMLQAYGDSSPMGLLWTFMGHSQVYSSFTGLAEILGGLLLLSRRTTTLGALVVVGVMSNVVMLNFCYDVSVKLFSSRLLLWALFLVALDRHRLYAFFTNTGDTQARLPPHLYTKRRAHVAGVVAKVLLVVAIGAASLLGPVLMRPEPPEATAALTGTYEVLTVKRDGVDVPPLVTDDERWHRVIVAPHGGLVVYSTSGARSFYGAKFDAEAGTVELTRRVIDNDEREDDVRSWAYSFDADTQTLVFHHEDDLIELKIFDPAFLLRDRGFHWIQERPFNR